MIGAEAKYGTIGAEAKYGRKLLPGAAFIKLYCLFVLLAGSLPVSVHELLTNRCPVNIRVIKLSGFTDKSMPCKDPCQ